MEKEESLKKPDVRLTNNSHLTPKDTHKMLKAKSEDWCYRLYNKRGFNIMKTYYNGQRSRRQEGTPAGNYKRQERRSDPDKDRAYNENLRYNSYEQEDLKNVKMTLKHLKKKLPLNMICMILKKIQARPLEKY